MSEKTKDFFISYTQVDRAWAEWITWQLEAAGYSTILQAWDFRPGSNFVLEMDKATKIAHRTLVLLSPDYINALYTQPEWAEAFRQDPKGEQGTLLPVRIRPCPLEGLLAAIGYIDLVNLPEADTKEKLLKGLRRERAIPKTPPPFPGHS
ncbi:toll/interleukin-1 receptor domain-containing protein [Ktedonosporobacter rubrisoli]|uniref:Toll/interleukin-1 receptor domain-containing protein n=2 Tax=Ktedonosporobacter rubrisoli TaxID=2509675 RepID=A0A4P6K604_KTERU|nr:toll/interleukin-1 receptor domain-containing protein [Ktedonosporobacter rubrisoli]